MIPRQIQETTNGRQEQGTQFFSAVEWRDGTFVGVGPVVPQPWVPCLQQVGPGHFESYMVSSSDPPADSPLVLEAR